MKTGQSIAFVTLVVAFSPLATAGRSQDNHLTDKAFIRKAVNKMEAAYLAKDAEGYVAYTDPDFVNVDLSGQETIHGKEERRQKLIAAFAKSSKLDAKITQHFTIRSITFSNGGATAIEESYLTYSGDVNGQAMVLKVHGVYQDFWVKSSAGWLEKRSRDISNKKAINRQPLP